MKFHLTLDTVAQALSYLDYNDRKEWYEMAFAIRSEFGKDGYSVWEDWGRQYAKYDKKEAENQWRSAKPHGGINIGTLIYRAKQAGFAFNDDDCVQISPEEIAARKAKREADERQYAAEQKQIRGEVARIANLAWEASLPAFEHPYTTRKGVKIYGARIGNFPVYKAPEPGKTIEPFKQIPALLVPIHAKSGKIVSLQAYFFEDQPFYGDRAYMKDGQKQGGYCLIGSPRDKMAIVEGYATGCSVHEATGWTVIVAFDKGNLKKVAEITRNHFPQAEIIIAGDNDVSGDGNKSAAEAGQAINGRVILPSTAGMDWNDVHQQDGLEAVQSALMAHLVPKPANDNKPVEFDSYTPFVDVTSNGKPQATLDNMRELLRRMGAVVRYNVIKKEDEILIPGKSFSVDNNANACIAEVISCCNKVGMPTGPVDGYLTNIADQNQFNPVITWVTSKPWDGTSRLLPFFETVTAKNPRTLPDGRLFHHALMRRWMISAIAAAFEPNGVAARGVLVFQGAQNLGKTKWFKSLAPDELDVLQDGVQLRPDDKDSVKQAVSNWLVELGELDATFKKSDIAALKAFITRKNDVMRRAYARKDSTYARRTVFFGSVNPRDFLHDTTGNTRYWTVECAAIDHTHGMDMQQVWAEVYALYQNGESWYLSDDELNMLNSNNEEFQVTDPIQERILAKLNWSASVDSWRWITATELLMELGIDRPTTGELRAAGAFVRKQNEDQTRRYGGKNQLLVPPKISFMGDDYDRPF